MGFFDCVAASLRETVTSLRMTGLHHQGQISIIRGHVITQKKISNKKPCRLHDRVSKESGSRISGRIRHSACGGCFYSGGYAVPEGQGRTVTCRAMLCYLTWGKAL